MNLNFLPKSIKTIVLSLFLVLGGMHAEAQYILGPEGFEGATFPPAGWTLNHSSSSSTYACTVDWDPGVSGAYLCSSSYYVAPAVVAHGGTKVAGYESWDIVGGSTGDLISPSLNMSSTAGYYQLSYWVYNYSTYYSDEIDVYVNTSPTSTGGYKLSTVFPNNYTNTAGDSHSSSSGYFKVTKNIPAAYATSSTYIIFHATSGYGYDMFMDDVSLIYIAPCSGAPAPPQITTAAISPLCSGGIANIAAFDPNTAGSLHYVWQSSTSGVPGTWSNVPAPDTTSYTTPVLTSTTYYRVGDSCGISNQVTYSTTNYVVPVNSYSIPYAEYFNTTPNTQIPYCFTENVTSSLQSKWGTNIVFRDANGTAYPSVISEDDKQGNYQSGKNAYFTLPALPMNAGETYRIRFGYERGRADYLTTNVAPVYPENLYLYENYAVQPPTSGTGIPGGTAATSLFSNVITVDGHQTASLTFTPQVSGAYFFSWYSNTPHPAGGVLIAGGLIAVDSIKIDSFGCTPPNITFQPQNSAVCLNGTTSLSVNATGYGLTYQWYKNSSLITGATSSVLTIGNAQFADSGSYKVIVTGTCDHVQNIQSNTVSLKVSAYPTDTISTTTTTQFCAGGSVVLTANTASGNSYQWQVNGNFIPNAFSPTYTATTAGNYTSVATNPYGCATASPIVNVKVLSASAVTISPSGPTTFCNGGSVTLTANGVGTSPVLP
ncbi:MAG: immunoglobulin domain-containing protein, partial [Flavipsychrobacter sp.]|nr:immunoglobulin domain-containing protein [Flavipsychrobacter sp.]